MRLINADALKKVMIETLEALLKNPKMDNQEAHLLAAFHTVGKMIDDAPTVDAVERKNGKWVLHPEVKNIYGGIYIECSECHTKYVVQYIKDEKYCRNCGADMRGEANEID